MAPKLNMIVILVLFVTTGITSAIQWLAVSQMSSLATVPHHPGLCNTLKEKGALVSKQVQFCRENPSFMEAVKLGALEAINECQFQFRTQRWNCSALTINDFQLILGHPPQDIDYRGRRSGGGSGGGGGNKNTSNKGNKKSPKASRLKSNRNNNSNARRYSRNSPLNLEYRDATAAPSVAVPTTVLPAVPGTPPTPGNMTPISTMQHNNKHLETNNILHPEDEIHKYENYDQSAPHGNEIKINYREEDRDNRQKKPGRRRKNRKRRLKSSPPSPTPFFSPVVPRGTREAAFVHAIASAGVAHAITLRCSSGALEDCGCDHSVKGRTPEGFRWSGCSHNIAYGVSLSKRFVDARDKKKVQKAQRAIRTDGNSNKKLRRVARALINLHNYEAGRQLIEQDMRVGCKCHGVSGSCELKTCWRQMPSFREVGENLKVKFDDATEVMPKKVGGRLKLVPNKQFFQKLSESDLVFGDASPEYCDYNPTGGSLGTHGRVCNKSSRGLDGCDLLCCDRGYTGRKQIVRERCSCKFHWCCYVECNTCDKEVMVYTCN